MIPPFTIGKMPSSNCIFVPKCEDLDALLAICEVPWLMKTQENLHTFLKLLGCLAYVMSRNKVRTFDHTNQEIYSTPRKAGLYISYPSLLGMPCTAWWSSSHWRARTGLEIHHRLYCLSKCKFLIVNHSTQVISPFLARDTFRFGFLFLHLIIWQM